MKKHIQIYWLLLLLIFFASCKEQNPKSQPRTNKIQIVQESNSSPIIEKFDRQLVKNAPKNITRTLLQDKKGNIWLATFEGIFKYDGHTFTNKSKELRPSRFFSVLEDSKDKLWFGSIGAGIYSYDGQSFQNFTTDDGLINNEIVCIYEDKSGHIWFGANGGVSRFDGKSFRNYKMTRDSMVEGKTENFLPNLQRPFNEVNAIIEDQTGKFWFGTRGNAFVYDGNTFTTVTHKGHPFTNVRWIIEDKKGRIWLGGKRGLWRYDGSTFANITQNFVGYIYEDKKGNIWTSSQNFSDQQWMLSRYDEKSLSTKKPTVTEIKSAYDYNKGMIFGILEAADGDIWFGALDGVYRYDGHTIIHFEEDQE